MLVGHEIDIKEIGKLEEEYLDKYIESDKRYELATDINYYQVLFINFLKEHTDKAFDKLNEDLQERTYNRLKDKFNIAMQYAFTKGHQIAFAIIFNDSKNQDNKVFHTSSFANENFSDRFINSFEDLMQEGALRNTLFRDAILMLNADVRKHFENGNREIMREAIVFAKKGAVVAINQIREEMLQIELKTSGGRTELMDMPYDVKFRVTPAFVGRFAFEGPGYEQWTISWDSTYGFKYSSGIVGKLTIHCFEYEEILAYAKIGAKNYESITMLPNWNSVNKEQNIYYVTLDILNQERDAFPREITSPEFDVIFSSISKLLSKQIDVDSTNILYLV